MLLNTDFMQLLAIEDLWCVFIIVKIPSNSLAVEVDFCGLILTKILLCIEF